MLLGAFKNMVGEPRQELEKLVQKKITSTKASDSLMDHMKTKHDN